MTERAWNQSVENKRKAGAFFIKMLQDDKVDEWVAKSATQTLEDLKNEDSGFEPQGDGNPLTGVKMHKSTPTVMQIAVPPKEFINEALKDTDDLVYQPEQEYMDVIVALGEASTDGEKRQILREYIRFRIGDYLMSHCRG